MKVRTKFIVMYLLSLEKYLHNNNIIDFPGGSVVKNIPANVGDAGDDGSNPGSGRSPGGGNGNPL